jgi:hypothetical protein
MAHLASMKLRQWPHAWVSSQLAHGGVVRGCTLTKVLKMIRQGASEDKTARQRPADFTRRHYGMVGLPASVAAQSRAMWHKIE